MTKRGCFSFLKKQFQGINKRADEHVYIRTKSGVVWVE